MSKKYDSDFYENLINTRSANYDTIVEALEIVKKFIIEKDLILVGGMAIDLALKLKGDRIYDDAQLPDYDFYSPTHTEHAFELGSMLCKKGYENISCIQATHITTMRVRIDFETVADITYCPPSLYDKIPTLEYDNMRLVHPHFQMMDQHSSLSIPFENPGREVIFHRWIKDMTRYDKLYNHYPVVPDVNETIFSDDLIVTLDMEKNKPKYNTKSYIRSPSREIKAKKLELKMLDVEVPMKNISNSCLCGWGSINYTIKKDSIILKIPEGEPISVATECYKNFINEHNLKNPKYYSEYFGKIPRKVICNSSVKNRDIEIYDTFGIKISAKKISEKYNLYVCNVQWCMVYLLVKIFSSPSKSVVFNAEEQYLECRRLVTEGNDYPSIEVYGNYNFTHSFLNKRKKDKEKIYQIKAVNLQPSNMFPKLPDCLGYKKFEPEKSEYFKTDMRLLDKFTDWVLNPYPEYTRNSVKK